MGFFAQNGGFATAMEWSIAPTGTYKCRLISVEVVDRPSFDDPAVLEPNFKWVFETTEVGDEDGKPYTFASWTKTSYGNDAAKLTKLLDAMVGKRMTKAEYSELDLDALMAKPWSVEVTQWTNMKGRQTNAIQAVRPFATPKTLPKRIAKPPVDEDITDPFED